MAAQPILPNPIEGATAILNLGSGSQRQHDFAEVLHNAFAERGVDLRIGFARSDRDLYSFARGAVSEGRPLVLAGGGDGTISAVASVLAGSQSVLGVLPLGTFNYFARMLSIPMDLGGAINACLDGEVRTVSLGEVNGRVFLNNASIGLYPRLLRAREKVYARWWRSQLLAHLSAIGEMLRLHPYYDLEMTTGFEKRTAQSALLFCVANPLQVESFSLPGASCLQGGRMAFYIVPPTSRLGWLRLGVKLLLRRTSTASDYGLMCGDFVRVDTKRQFIAVAYDGEVERMRSPLFFRMRHNALRVMAPRAAEPAA